MPKNMVHVKKLYTAMS